MKPSLSPYWRFVSWSILILGSGVLLGLPDPLDTRKEIDANDLVRESLKAVLIAWFETFGERPVVVKDIIAPENGSTVLIEALESAVFCRGSLNAKAVGRWLAKHKERRISGFRIVQMKADAKGSVWKVVRQ